MDKLIKIHNGVVTTLYADDLPELGTQKIQRASEVEPEADGDGWFVKLTDHPRNGKWAGHTVARHVPTRAVALACEIQFIQDVVLQGKEPGICLPNPL
jgi:hypothetical protein